MTRTDPLLLPDEAELRDLLERTMSGTTAPAEIGPHALQEGRRLRMRRRVSLAAVAVAASAAAALILPAALGGGSATVVDPAGEPSSSATAPVPEPPSDERPDGWWTMPATEMVTALEAILPDGITVTDSRPLSTDTPEGGQGAGMINAIVTTEAGPGRLIMMLYPTMASPTESFVQTEGGETIHVDVTPLDGGDISCPGNLVPRAECTEIRAADDNLIGRRSSTTFGQVTTLEVVLRRNGGTVYAAAVNTLDDSWGAGAQPTASAEAPPLTLDQLEDLVRNDTWVMPAT